MIFLGLAILCMSLHIFSFIVVLCRRFWKPKGIFGKGEEEKVTILRPVSNLEYGLRRTLASTFELDHKHYEIIFCVADKNDKAIPLIESLISEYPDADAKLLIGNDKISDNPKLNNLVKGWHQAKYP